MFVRLVPQNITSHDQMVDLLCGTTAAEVHNSVDLLCDTTAAELHNSLNSVNLLCGLTTAAELPNPLDLLCDTKPAELNPVWCRVTNHAEKYEGLITVRFNSKLLKNERFGRFSKHRSMYALRRFSELFKRWTLYEDRISDLSKPLKDERRGHTKHHVS